MATKSDWRIVAASNLAKKLKKRSIPLKFGDNHIGRNKVCDVQIPSIFCSKIHCNITVDGEFVTLIDRSRNGTFVNDRRILNQCSASLNENDTITIGPYSGWELDDENAFVFVLVRDTQDSIEIVDTDEEIDVSETPQEDDLKPSTTSNESNDATSNSFGADKFHENEERPESTHSDQIEQQSNDPTNLLDGSKTATTVHQQTDDENSNGGKLTAKRVNEVNITDFADTFQTKVKVKVAKHSHAEMLFADMLTSPADVYTNL